METDSSPVGSAGPTEPVRVCIIFDPQESTFEVELEAHLGVLERQGLIEIWHRGRARVGEDIEADARLHMDAAEIVVVLLSAGLLASDDCAGELTRALERQRKGQVQMVPVLARSCDLKATPIVLLQVVPRNGQAMSSLADRHVVWAEIAGEIQRAAAALRDPRHERRQQSSWQDNRGSRSGGRVRWLVAFGFLLSIALIGVIIHLRNINKRVQVFSERFANQKFEPEGMVDDLKAKNRDGKEVYRFSVWLHMPPEALSHIKRVTYDFDHPTWRGTVEQSEDRANSFRISYEGWGCLTVVTATIFFEDGSFRRLDPFDGCALIGW